MRRNSYEFIAVKEVNFMNEGYVQVFCGNGEGKSSAALGKAMIYAMQGKSSIVVKFMKKKDDECSFLKRLEPEIKMFRFEKNDICFRELSEEDKAEEITNIRNGLNYARKVLTTGECEVLILDEVLGLIDEGIIDSSELIPILESKSDDTIIIMTGIYLPEEIKKYTNHISVIETLN